MNISREMPRLKGFRFAREIIALRHGLIIASRSAPPTWKTCLPNAVSLSAGKQSGFGSIASGGILQFVSGEIDVRLTINGTSEVVITIGGKKHWLWGAIDGDGHVLDILVQPRRNAKAARRFLRGLVARFGMPRVVVTDKLRSYIKPIRTLAAGAGHRAHKGLNNAVEVSHKHRGFSLPTTRSI